MKKFTFLIFLFLLITAQTVLAQKVAVIGYNGTTGDGYSIVALETITGGTVIYFTDKAYDAANNVFSMNEGVWSYTAPVGGLSPGDVVTFSETGTSTNVLNIVCSSPLSPGCGTFNLVSGIISLASTSAEGLYAYSDADNDPTNGITEIYAVLYSQGNIPANENPQTGGDFPMLLLWMDLMLHQTTEITKML